MFQEESKMPLPDGWIRVESRSRPGEMVYENTVTKVHRLYCLYRLQVPSK